MMSTNEQVASGREPRAWLPDIQNLKGLAIVLVVWAHVYDANFPDWALGLRAGIYAFHMPLFMFLSGYVFVHVGAHRLRGAFSDMAAKRARRLLIPFGVMALLVIAGKLVAGQVLSVDKPISDIAGSIVTLFYRTEDSPVLFLWYLVVLFWVSILTVLLHVKAKLGLLQIFAISIAMHLLHIVLYYRGITLDVLYLNRVIFYYVFFMAGCVACLHKDQWLAFVDRYWMAAVIPFLATDITMLGTEWRYVVVGFLSMVVFHGLVRRFFSRSAVLEFLGEYTFAIYLLNMLFIGLTKGVLGKLVGPPADYALPTIVLCTLAGLGGPIAVKFVLKHIAMLRPVAKAMD